MTAPSASKITMQRMARRPAPSAATSGLLLLLLLTTTTGSGNGPSPALGRVQQPLKPPQQQHHHHQETGAAEDSRIGAAAANATAARHLTASDTASSTASYTTAAAARESLGDDGATSATDRELLQFAPADCLNGWTISGGCVSATRYYPPVTAVVAGGGSSAYSSGIEYSQRCTKWTPDLVKRAATRIGCIAGSLVCGPKAVLCRTVCTSLAAVAQAQCVDKREISTFIEPGLVKTSYVCCAKCSALDKLFNRCPA